MVSEDFRKRLTEAASGAVHPAAGLAQQASYSGAKTVLLNKDEPENIRLFKESIYGNGTEIVPEFFNNLLKEQG